MVENIDTYVTIEEADKFASEMYSPAHPLMVTWEVLTDEEKERFLFVALERIENLNYIGQRVSYFQKLQFPRIANGIPVDFEHAPESVKKAQTAWALEIVREELYIGRRNADACVALGLIEQNERQNDAIPEKVKDLLKRWLTSWRKI